MKNIKISDCKEIGLDKTKRIMLDMLIEFDQICKDNNLTYWLIFGTLLGCINESGYIPWDDDIDIMMPRHDFDKLEFIHFPKNLFYQNRKTDIHYKKNYSKLRMNNTLYVEIDEKGKDIKYHQGIFIDIFPVNYIKDRFRTFYVPSLVFIKKIIHEDRFYIKWLDLSKYFMKFLNSFHRKENETLVSMEYPKFVVSTEKEIYFPLKKGLFENNYFPIPNHSDRINFELFGQYNPDMKNENRKIHHYKIYIKKQNLEH